MSDTQELDPQTSEEAGSSRPATPFDGPSSVISSPSGGASLFARWLLVATTFVVSASLFMQRYQVPYYYLAPGPPTNVLEAIHVKGATTYPSKGELLLTTASVGQQRMNLWDVLAVWIDPNAVAVPERDLGRGGVTSDEDLRAQGVSDMESSKINAELAAYRALGFEVPVQDGAYVLATFSGTGADAVLETGDVIIEVEGTRVTAASAIRPTLQGKRVGDEISITFLRDGQRRTAQITLKTMRKDGEGPALGVEIGTVYRFPHNVEIDTGRVIGPSGGLVFALSLADALSEDDLTRGHTVAVTGTLGPTRYSPDVPIDGVGPIGAIDEKVRSARASEADVFIVPAEQEAKAREHAPDSMTIIGVRTLTEAIEALRALEPAS